MHNLQDVTFNIPIRVDSKERARNLFIVFNYLKKEFNTNIIICEEGTRFVPSIIGNDGYEYIHLNDCSGVIHRARQFNIMAHKTKTEIIANYDCDIVLSTGQYTSSAQLIRDNVADIVYPYDGRFLELPDNIVIKFAKDYDVSIIETSTLPHVGPPEGSIGGSVFYRKDKFIEYGMENEKISGWAYDDNERYIRFVKLGARIERVGGPLLHLVHKKNLYPLLLDSNVRECNRIGNMTRDELLQEIQGWEWCRDDYV